MVALIFLLALVVVLYLIHRSGRRGRKYNEAVETNRDLRNELKVKEIEDENDWLASQINDKTENK